MRWWRRATPDPDGEPASLENESSAITDLPAGEGVRLVPVSQSPASTGPAAAPPNSGPPGGGLTGGGLAGGEPPEVAAGDGGLVAGVQAPKPAPGPVPSSMVKPTTLVIGEDDVFVAEPGSSGPIAGGDGSTPIPIDPRIRRRRIDVRRAAGRKRLLVVLAIASVFLVALAALAVLASPLFSVSEVQVSGAVYTSDAELAPIIERAKDQAILTLDTDAIAAELEQLPWVSRARVEANFPSTLKIELAERRPVAAYAGEDGRWRVIDRDGRVIAIIPGGAQPADYLPIDGPGPNVEAGVAAGDRYQVAGELALSLPLELRNVTAAVTLGDLGTIGLRLTSGTEVDFGQPSDLRTKLAVLIALLREDDPSGLAELNLSDPYNPGRTRSVDSPNSDS